MDATLNGDNYVILLKSKTGLYELTVASDGSGITSIHSIEHYD
ncbi:hypothetical protein ACFVQB_23545 [Paenibacillus sp. NPDC057886]